MNKYSCIYFNLSSTTNLKNVRNDKNENKNIENKNNNKNNRELFVTKDVFVENEIYISSQIKQMINYYKYFYIINKVEKINYMSIENKNVYENVNVSVISPMLVFRVANTLSNPMFLFFINVI